jgi:putative toxin-antitoxin system antitoxin component (TIGR02293 family)
MIKEYNVPLYPRLERRHLETESGGGGGGHTSGSRYLQWHQRGPVLKIDIIRAGVPAQLVGDLSAEMGLSKETVIDFLGLSRTTVNRKAQKHQPLSREESERVVGVQSLIGQVQAMVANNAEAIDFDAAKWLARWLNAPLPALGGSTPASYLDTIEGQKYVSNLLAMAESGAYA